MNILKSHSSTTKTVLTQIHFARESEVIHVSRVKFFDLRSCQMKKWFKDHFYELTI